MTSFGHILRKERKKNRLGFHIDESSRYDIKKEVLNEIEGKMRQYDGFCIPHNAFPPFRFFLWLKKVAIIRVRDAIDNIRYHFHTP